MESSVREPGHPDFSPGPSSGDGKPSAAAADGAAAVPFSSQTTSLPPENPEQVQVAVLSSISQDHQQQTVEPLRFKSSRSASHSHALSSSSASVTAASRKSRHAEPGTTETHADRASLSMPPPISRPLKNPRASLPQSRRESSNSDAWNEDLVADIKSNHRGLDSPQGPGQDAEYAESDTPRLGPGSLPDTSFYQPLPEAALMSSRSSLSEDAKRRSISSIYSFTSARGVISSAASANGSESGAQTLHHTVSGLMASGAGNGFGPGSSTPPEAGLSNVTVTTGSHGAAGAHHLYPRDSHTTHMADLLKRNAQQTPRSDPGSNAPRAQAPTRSRSRAKRRFSGSTAASSHSPSSDRAAPQREREEGE